MSEYIFVKLGDEMYEKTFQETFKGIIVEINGRRFTIPTSKFLELLRDADFDFWAQEIRKQKILEAIKKEKILEKDE